MRGVEKRLEMRTARVVLVDDDADIRRVLSTLLIQEGIDVVGQAEDGEKAINIVGRSQPNVVVMDLMMPILGGDDAAREIAARWPEIIIVGLTAGDASARDRLLEAGSHVVFDKTEIIQILDWFAQERQNESAHYPAAAAGKDSGRTNPAPPSFSYHAKNF